MQAMYPAQPFSPTTALAASITATDTTIPVVDLSKLPPAPNLVTIGEGPNAETVLYTGTDTNAGTLTGVTRGFQGAAKAWEAGTPVARLFTAYDHDAFKANIEEVSQRITAHEEAADPHPQYAPDEHEHEMADVQGLQAALDNKASKSHTHTLAQITDAGTAAARNVEDFAIPSSVEEVRGIAEAAQAAADAAQETADTALSAAQSAGQAAANAQATADSATALAGIAADSCLVVEAVLPVEGAEPEQVLTAAGPAVQFSPGATQSVTFCRRWPFSGQALAMELVLAADQADGGAFAVQVGWQVNGGALNTVTRTITPGAHTNLYVADLGQIIPTASLPAGALVTLTLSRLGADAADTHPGTLLIYHCRLRRG